LTDNAELLNDAEEANRLMLEGWQSGLWTAMPGIVQSVDFSAMTCTVQPSIKGSIQAFDGLVQSVNYPLLLDVPIVFPQAGGFILTFPMAMGDEVLVVFASRCIDAWWQSGGTNNLPMEARMHDLSDGFCIPGPRSQPNVISGISADSVQLRSNDGTSYVEIQASGNINIVAPTGLTITGNLVVDGTITGTDIKTAAGIDLALHTHISASPGNPTGPALP
jgi:Phage protein Gp138 N-terminal domain